MKAQIWKSRGSKEFPRKFVPKEVDLGDWERIEPLFKNLLERDLETKKQIEKWLKDLSELEACLDEEGSRRYILMTCNTTDEDLEKAYLHFITEVEPKLKPYSDKLNRKYLESPARKKLDPERYLVYDRDIENDVKLFREENVPLQTEDDKLRQQYQKLCGSLTVQFDGEERTMPQMRKYLEVTDRSIRKDAWTKTSEQYLTHKDEFDTIYDKQIELRDQIAKNAGFPNYRDYIHLAKSRFDYTPEDCYAFHSAVEDLIVPINRKLAQRRKENLGVDILRPWDLQVDEKGRDPLRPFETGSELEEGVHKMFSNIDPELAEQFALMRNNSLLDLESRKGKAPGGYQCGLEEVRYPFIFMNAAGTDSDVFTLLHEGGHAFHSFACREDPMTTYRNPPLEFAEVASMSMELFGLDFLGEFYSDEEARRSRESTLEGILKVLAWIATIDAFQHWVYLNPHHSREERKDFWLSLQDRFGSGVDWTGFEDAKAHAWHRQLHPFTVPFYYIEYGIAQLGALQLWVCALDDLAAAVADYKEALTLGGSRPLPELFAKAGIRFGFDKETVGPLSERLIDALDLNGVAT
ncbi:MAG: M3 family oligoendopeptidase [Candidatus Omnitrophica bacterium]|nr:M3 family oligoendopeptidase [Candidatus Omnitrophota bacterium]